MQCYGFLAYRLNPSNKSTIACALEQHLLHLHKFVYRLDGDNIRFGLCKDLGFDEPSRNENIRRIGEVGRLKSCTHLSLIVQRRTQVAKLFADSSCIAITAFISPYIVDRALARELHEKANMPFIEVFVDAPLDIVEKRDPKGLYKKARAGEIRGLLRVLSPQLGIFSISFQISQGSPRHMKRRLSQSCTSRRTKRISQRAFES